MEINNRFIFGEKVLIYCSKRELIGTVTGFLIRKPGADIEYRVEYLDENCILKSEFFFDNQITSYESRP